MKKHLFLCLTDLALAVPAARITAVSHFQGDFSTVAGGLDGTRHLIWQGGCR